jgi:hypothetical protein
MTVEAGRMDELLTDLREAQRKLAARVRRLPALGEHLDALVRLETIATARPRVIVLGEPNAGKTSVANLLLDAAVLPDSVVANTRRPLVLHYADAVGVTAIAGKETIALPIDMTESGAQVAPEQSHVPVEWQGRAAGTTLPPVGGEGRSASRSEADRGGGTILARNLLQHPPPRSLRSRPSPPLRGGRVESATQVESYASVPHVIVARFDRIDVGLPNPRLSAFDLMDTPGLSSSAQLDELELRSTDMLIWCTVATQAWKDSERRLWTSIPARHRRDAVLVATHGDALRNGDLRKVRARLAAETQDLFGTIVFVKAGGSIERASDMLPGSGEAELAITIEDGLRAIRKRRHDAVCRLACEIMGEALTLLEHGPRRPLLRLARIAAPSVIPIRAT